MTNPCNPTGVLTPKSELIKISEICKENNCWLVLDNTYEYFVYNDDDDNDNMNNHSTIEGVATEYRLLDFIYFSSFGRYC